MVSLVPLGATHLLDVSGLGPDEGFGAPEGAVVLNSECAVFACTGADVITESRLLLATVNPVTGAVIGRSIHTVPFLEGNIDMFPIDPNTVGFVAMPEGTNFGAAGSKVTFGTVNAGGAVNLHVATLPYGPAEKCYGSSGLGFYDQATKRWAGKYWTSYSVHGPFVGYGLVLNFTNFRVSSYPLTQYMGFGEDVGDIYYGTFNLPDGRVISARSDWANDRGHVGSMFFVVDQEGREIYRTPPYQPTEYNDDLTIRQVGRSSTVAMIWSRDFNNLDFTDPISVVYIDTANGKFSAGPTITFGEAYPDPSGLHRPLTDADIMLRLNDEDSINVIQAGPFRTNGNTLFGGIYDPVHDYVAVQDLATYEYAIATLDKPEGDLGQGSTQCSVTGDLVLGWADATAVPYYRLFGASFQTRGPRLTQRTDGLGTARAPKRLAQNTGAQTSAPRRLAGLNTYP